MTDTDITLGEIGRSVDRIEATVNNLALIVQATSSLTATHSVKLETAEKRTDEVEKKLDSLATRSAYISGGIATIAAGINFFLGRH